MRLRIGIFVLAFVWTIFPFRASAIPLADGPHDLTSVTGAPADICQECHIPHNAREKALYIRDLTPDTVEPNDNCYDCHDANRIVLTSPPQPPTWATSAPDVGYLKGSLHDWNRTGNTQPIATLGSCSPCHDIHLPDSTTASYMGTWFTTSRLWTRDLSLDLAEYYQKRELSRTSGTPNNDGPNYLVGSTILCYDCHGGAARRAPTGDPFVPDDSDFSPAPQDIAFGGDRGVKALSDGSNVGYYELPDGYEPAGVTHVAPSMSAVRDSPDNPDNVPGGHYVLSWMGNSGTAKDDNYEVRDPDGTLLYRISIGDKLPCELCHDPHLKESATNTQPDEVFFRRDIHTGENEIVTRTESDFNGKLEASSHTRNGAGGVGDGRLMCIYCHGTGDWDGSQFPSTGVSPLVVDWGQKLTIFGIRIRTGTYANESPAFPPPNTVADHFETATKVCTDCHQHNHIRANCGACHEFPPSGGAHTKHAQTQAAGGVQITCDVCHGVGAMSGTHLGHNEGNGTVLASNITLLGQSNYEAVYATTRPSWYSSTWGSAASVTWSTRTDATCQVRCHGNDTPAVDNDSAVAWSEKADSTTFNNVCLNCHDLAVSSFQLPGDANSYRASNAAANYQGPVSGFSRGGHGDSNINDPSWFLDTAPGSTVPLACVACHDETQAHFPVVTGNPYRVSSAALGNNLPGASPAEGPLSNLCTQTNCHPKVIGSGNFAFLASPKHPNDHFPISAPVPIYVNYPSEPVNLESVSDTTSPAYDPAGRSNAVGLHIDRYVDHWAYWGAQCTADGGDDEPFLPLGDSLTKQVGDVFDNNVDSPSSLVTCITCHNPHGTDLFVAGQICGSGSTSTSISSNRMLRLRNQDDELCLGCHE